MSTQHIGNPGVPDEQCQSAPEVSSGGTQVHFAFDEVKEAYKPSGRVGPEAPVLMVVFGLLAAVGVGILQSFPYAWMMADPLDWLGPGYASLGGALLIPLLIIIAAGALLGGAIWLGARVGKSTSYKLTRLVAVVAGIANLLVTLVAVTVLSRSADKGAVWWILFVILAVALLLVPVVAALVATTGVETSPFCDTCKRFMGSRELAELPVSAEGELLGLLNARAMAEAAHLISTAALPAGTKKGDRLKVSMSSCPQCKQRGFLDVTTYLSKTFWDGNTQREKELEKRLVFSSELNGSEIAALSTIRASSAGPQPAVSGDMAGAPVGSSTGSE